MEKAVIIEGARTPFGVFGGSLRDTSALQLGTHVTKAALSRSGIPASEIDEVVFGNVILTDAQSMYLARHIGLNAGVDQSTPALTLNRLCGSGLEAVVNCASSLMLGTRDVVVAGGVENMSQVPYIANGARWGNQLGNAELVDVLYTGLNDSYVNQVMGYTAENLADDFTIPREAQDEWATISHSRARKAQEKGIFDEEITVIKVRKDGKRAEFSADEGIRSEEELAKLPKLSSVFKQGGSVTAGNASGLNDGASALVLSTESYAKQKGIKPLARILGWGQVGCDPTRMGLGPVFAIPKALKMAGLELNQIDLIEVNEAFAAQFLAVKQQLNLDPERTNVNGGALALGHPLGASGNRVLYTLTKELRRRNGRYGVASLCIGGGQGIAAVIEAIPD